MILAQDYGYTLRCSGCQAYITLTLRETRDLDHVLDLKSAMRQVHRNCDGFRNVALAAAAMKARIRAERRAASRTLSGAVHGGSTQ